LGVTLKTIAERAGVSVTTVSLVLNDRPVRVSDAVRDRVHRIADDLDYTPNLTARRLAGGRTMTVAVLINSLLNDFFCQYLRSIEACLRPKGYHLLPFESRALPERAKQVKALIDGGICDALISLEDTAGSGGPKPRDGRVPVVLRQEVYGEVASPSDGVRTLRVDYGPALRQLGAHFRDVGATRVGILALGWNDPALPEGERSPRADAFARVFSDCGLFVSPSQSSGVEPGRTLRDWHDATIALLEREPGIDCLVVHNMLVMPPVLEALRAMGRAPGEDIAVATYDDSIASEWMARGMTVIREPIDELSRLLVDLTLGELGGGPALGDQRAQADLAVRFSSGLRSRSA